MNEKVLEKELLQIKNAVTMPENLAVELSETALEKGQKKLSRSCRSGRFRSLCAAAAALLCLCAIGTTSFAYNTYQEKQLAVFMETDLTQSEIDSIGHSISTIPGISACQYISGDEAWAQFKKNYFTDSDDADMAALADAFTENPLADSFNYRVSVRLDADTQTVRQQISALSGVRRITTVREAKAEAPSPEAVPLSP